MLDAGVTLEPERVKLVDKLGSAQPEAWSPADLAEYQKGMNPDVGGVPLKLVYGSDFAYKEANEHLAVNYGNVGLRPSFAQGGLSNVWGAAMMPFRDEELTDWPIKLSALDKHYRAVLRITGLAARHDALEEFFPLHTNDFTELRLSRQAQQLLTRMEKHRGALARQGIHFGHSRIAVRGNRRAQSDGCVYCRLCMYGCPYGFIYNSKDTLEELRADANFTYEPGVVVESVSESERGLEVSGYELSTRLARAWQGDRVFLAAGAIPTTRILLKSLAAYDRPVLLRDSQYFLLPLALTKRARGVREERLHALSQLFIEILNSNSKTVHIQVYSHSDLVAQAVGQSFGFLKRPLEVLVRNLEERLLVTQGFMHSDYGSRIVARLKKEGSPGIERLELRAELNPSAKPAVKKVMHLLLKNSRLTGAIPLTPLLKIAEPGRSFHCGGSFPMSNNPREFQTDLLGRPAGWKRIHAVDATIFPSVPATTITLSVMANAHRIGWEAAGVA
jgi:choline dehydrogenase-like flavoprotein